MQRVLDYDFHPPDDLRLFTFQRGSVLRFDDSALIGVVDHRGTLLRHYAFANRWFKINVTTDPAGNLVEEQPDSTSIPFCFNCDIATPMLKQGNTVFAVDLWIDVLVRADGLTYQIVDEDEFAAAQEHGWLSAPEVQGARRGLADLIELIERKQLVPFLADLFPFGSRCAPRALDMQRASVADFPIVQPGVRPTW